MTTKISDDVRAAVEYMEAVTGHPAKYPESLVTRLRAHADLLERIEGEMRDSAKFSAGIALRDDVKGWASVLSAGGLE